MTKRRVLMVALSGLIAIVLAIPSAAQVATGTIVGTVSDPDGVVPGAIVTIREVSTGTSETYRPDSTGSHAALFLVPGTYKIEVNVQGFKTRPISSVTSTRARWRLAASRKPLRW